MNTGPLNPASEPVVHTYKPGETLIEIALSYGVSIEELTKVNGLTQLSMLYPGLQLVIPLLSLKPFEKELPKTHLVERGETLIAIADRYRLRVSDIQRFNKLGDGAILFPGMILELTGKLESEVEQVEVSESFPKHCLIHGYHKVKPGDQLARVAAFHGISTQSLLSANSLSWNSVVSPGSKLIVPIAHNALNCPNLVQLSETSKRLASELIELARSLQLEDKQIVAALCLEMQRSGLLPDLGKTDLTLDLVKKIQAITPEEKIGVRETLVNAGYLELAEGASRWEPSAWLWLHQVGSKHE